MRYIACRQLSARRMSGSARRSGTSLVLSRDIRSNSRATHDFSEGNREDLRKVHTQ